MVPVEEFFRYFGVIGFYGVNMTNVENMMLFGEEVMNKSYPTLKDIVVSDDVKVEWNEYYDLYKNSLLSE
jgi:hypothetical protein